MNAVAGRLPYLAQVALIAVVYIAVAQLSLLFAIPPGYATPVWPPSGIALAALLLFGNRAWPGVALGAALANFAVEGLPFSALLIGGGNSLEALASATLIRRFAGEPAHFRRADEVFAFIAACAAGAVIAASVALLPLLHGHALSAAEAWRNWWTWWQGDFTGMLVLTPLILSWSIADARAWAGRQKLEAGAFFAALFASAIAISSDGASHFVPYALTFLSLPFILWAAFRFGQREATAVVGVVCAVAVWYSVRRRGEFADVPLNELLLMLLTFIGIVVATGLVLVAVVDERSRMVAGLRESRGDAAWSPERRRDAGSEGIERQLRLAIERREFVLHYQPKVDLDTRRIVGLEALIRWNSPQLGAVAPVHFIPRLEASGMILDVGSWVLGRALLDQRAWLEAGLPVPRVAVNVSPLQLRQPDFVALVLDAIAPATEPPLIDLELTESCVMENIEDSIGKLSQIRAHGIGVAIDDFGTGYSSLAYLTKLPAQTLKIDRSFIHKMLEDDQSMTLVQTIISLAQSLKLTTVAEGVETEEQSDVLEMLRCDQMQGYLVSRPLPVEFVTDLLRSAPSRN